MTVFTDQLGKKVTLEKTPQRIISLVPSQTELLFDLGAGDRVVGITKFCIHPNEWFRNKQHVGGTKNFKPEVIRTLKPDLIIANKEENDLSLLEPLMNEYPVWISDISNLDDACSMIESVGELIDEKEKSTLLINDINYAFAVLKSKTNFSIPKKVAYFIWKDPWMSVGADTFIHDMLVKCGFNSVFGHQLRYPICSLEELKILNPELIFLSSEPFPFKVEHAQSIQDKFPLSKVTLVDSEYFSWYGSRLKKSPSYFIQLADQLKNHD